MQGRIYISGSFLKVSPPSSKSDWRDNCPHFWTDPPTWGICRFDFRAVMNDGDYVFFVLPKSSPLPQMIYGYMKIKEIISHLDAFHRHDLTDKQMGNKNPNGNIIVDENGNYNRFDGGAHQKNFDKIKLHYAVGDSTNSAFLNEATIKRKAPDFHLMLRDVFNQPNTASPFEIISRKGRLMNSTQIELILNWLKS